MNNMKKKKNRENQGFRIKLVINEMITYQKGIPREKKDSNLNFKDFLEALSHHSSPRSTFDYKEARKLEDDLNIQLSETFSFS
jgi:hypothetical protein